MMKNSAYCCRGAFAVVAAGVLSSVASAQIVFDVPTGFTETSANPFAGPTGVIVDLGGDPAFQGTQILTGGGPATGNTYSGDTDIEGGTLAAGVGSGVGNAFSPNSNFVLSGTGTLDLNGQTETIASLASDSATTVVTNSGNGDGVLIVNGNAELPDYVGTITDGGAGNTLSLVVEGNQALVLTGVNTFSGGTTITGADLVVTANALGTGNVANNGGLFSTTYVGSPAQDIVIGGNYSQTTAALLALMVTDSPSPAPAPASGVAGTDYDTVSVAGTATLGGELLFIFANGTTPSRGQQFVTLTAGAPLTTVFDSRVTNLPHSDIPVVTYNDTFGGPLNATAPADSVVLTVVKAFTTYGGLTPNQYAVGGAVDSSIYALNRGTGLLSPTGNVRDFINNIVTGLDYASYVPGEIGPSLDQLSPERLNVLRNVAIDNYTFDVLSLDDELARERYGRGGIDTSGFAVYDPTLGAALSQIKSRLLAWNPAPEKGLLSDSPGAALGGVEMTDPKDAKNVPEMAPVYAENKVNTFVDGGVDLGDLEHDIDDSHSTYTTGRVRAGADYLVARDVRVGALFGYSHTEADLDNEGSKARVDSFTPGLYAAYADKHGFYANALLTGTYNSYTTDRRIIIPGVDRTAHGDPDGYQFGANIDGGYEFRKGNWTFGPAAGLTYTHMDVNSFNESQAMAASLDINDWNTDSLRSRLGAAVRYSGRICDVTLTPHLSAFWQHEFLDDKESITSHFDGVPGSDFSVELPDGDSDTALIDFGLDAEVTKNVTVFLDYETEAGGDTFYGQAATGGVKVSF